MRIQSTKKYPQWSDLVKQPRLAGMVNRYHTHPTREKQPISSHVYNMMRIWWLIWGPLPPHISTNMLWHDSEELATSDISHTTKEACPEIRPALQQLGHQARLAMGGPVDDTVSEYETVQIKVCDLLEMLEYALVEIAFGNRFAYSIVDAAMKALKPNLYKLYDMHYLKVEVYLCNVFDTAEVYGVDLTGFTIVFDNILRSSTTSQLVRS